MSSIYNWMVNYPISLVDQCLVRITWDESQQLHHIDKYNDKRAVLYKRMFLKMSDHQKLSNGNNLIVFAAIENKMSSKQSELTKRECSVEIKDGMFYYSMAMGDGELLRRFLTPNTCYSCSEAFAILPSRDLYISDRAYEYDLGRLIQGVIRSDCKPMLKMLLDMFSTCVFDEIRIQCKYPDRFSVKNLDNAYSRTNAEAFTTSRFTSVATDCLENSRTDLISWMLGKRQFKRLSNCLMYLCALRSSEYLEWILNTFDGNGNGSAHISTESMDSCYVGPVG